MKKKILIENDNYEINNVLYTAAFIDPNIISVKYVNKEFEFTYKKHIKVNKLTKYLKLLTKRFPKIENNNKPLFVINNKKIIKKDYLKEIFDKDIIQEVDQGLFIYREPISTLINFLDYSIVKFFSNPFKAKEEMYPNAIKMESLIKANYVNSFPEHLIFNCHLLEDIETINKFVKSSNKATFLSQENNLSRINLVQNPSTCYHCYASRENEYFNKNIVITAINKCNRYEASNHSKKGRMQEFSLREVIFLGSPSFIKNTRFKTVKLLNQFVTNWQINGELISSNDPFFTNEFKTKASFQLHFDMKYEYKAKLPYENKTLAIMSSNIHGTTFSKNFNLKSKKNVIHTGCLGFGLERLALVIIAQHGYKSNKWPKKMLRDFNEWKKNNN